MDVVVDVSVASTVTVSGSTRVVSCVYSWVKSRDWSIVKSNVLSTEDVFVIEFVIVFVVAFPVLMAVRVLVEVLARLVLS